MPAPGLRGCAVRFDGRDCVPTASYFAGVTAYGAGTLESPILWIAMRRTAVGGRRCREYTVTNEAGRTLLTARAFNWDREMLIAHPDGTPCISIIRSRAFALNGRAAVRELPSKGHLGVVTRNGTFKDSRGAVRGRFQDARSLRQRTRESLFQAAGEALLSAGEGSVPSGSDSFVLNAGGRPAGTLTYAKLPFARENEQSAPSRMSELAARLLPNRWRNMWHSINAPRGWRLERSAPLETDPRPQLAAAIFAIELSRW